MDDTKRTQTEVVCVTVNFNSSNNLFLLNIEKIIFEIRISMAILMS